MWATGQNWQPEEQQTLRDGLAAYCSGGDRLAVDHAQVQVGAAALCPMPPRRIRRDGERYVVNEIIVPAMTSAQSHLLCRRIVPIIQNLKIQNAHPNNIQRKGSNAKLGYYGQSFFAQHSKTAFVESLQKSPISPDLHQGCATSSKHE